MKRIALSLAMLTLAGPVSAASVHDDYPPTVQAKGDTTILAASYGEVWLNVKQDGHAVARRPYIPRSAPFHMEDRSGVFSSESLRSLQPLLDEFMALEACYGCEQQQALHRPTRLISHRANGKTKTVAVYTNTAPDAFERLYGRLREISADDPRLASNKRKEFCEVLEQERPTEDRESYIRRCRGLPLKHPGRTEAGSPIPKEAPAAPMQKSHSNQILKTVTVEASFAQWKDENHYKSWRVRIVRPSDYAADHSLSYKK
jgi:hypothetical protein